MTSARFCHAGYPGYPITCEPCQRTSSASWRGHPRSSASWRGRARSVGARSGHDERDMPTWCAAGPDHHHHHLEWCSHDHCGACPLQPDPPTPHTAYRRFAHFSSCCALACRCRRASRPASPSRWQFHRSESTHCIGLHTFAERTPSLCVVVGR